MTTDGALAPSFGPAAWDQTARTHCRSPAPLRGDSNVSWFRKKTLWGDGVPKHADYHRNGGTNVECTQAPTAGHSTQYAGQLYRASNEVPVINNSTRYGGSLHGRTPVHYRGCAWALLLDQVNELYPRCLHPAGGLPNRETYRIKRAPTKSLLHLKIKPHVPAHTQDMGASQSIPVELMEGQSPKLYLLYV